ncbi:rhodanese-like domain-containing protein [Periweissella beninensis]|uniref:rhodanese-like domain-containing protein n=1 Tax=Periweissella beninensis TaxID=504936 RepID=UPI0021A6B54B|nr:rhodanese-like domain-containing protein [Periweissella beninensis]
MTLNIIAIIILLAWGGYILYWYLAGRNAAKYVKQEEYVGLMHTSQIIDLREKDEYRRSHIMGARNIPFSIFKQSYNGIRKDKSVLLYDTTTSMSTRAAITLKKAGYQDIVILKGGFTGWTGKKANKNG